MTASIATFEDFLIYRKSKFTKIIKNKKEKVVSCIPFYRDDLDEIKSITEGSKCTT